MQSRPLARTLMASSVALAAASFAPAASALSLDVIPLVPRTASLTATNDFFDDTGRIFEIGPLVLELEGAPAAQITYTFLFEESSFANSFTSQGSTLNDPGDLFGTIVNTQSADGALDFSFNSALLGSVANEDNAPGNGAMPPPPNFGILLDQDLTTALSATSPVALALAAQSPSLLTQYDALLFFNDRGAGVDRDFDDMVIGVNIAAVPEPGTYALMAAGLLALGWIGRRRLR